MSIETQLNRIRAAKTKIRNKLVSLGLASSTDNIDKLATTIDGIVSHTNIQAEILEGSSYTIPQGYHNGSGKVTAKTDVEGDYKRYLLQAKTGIIPSDKQQSITNDEGYYGLSSVTVEPIPNNFKDVSNVTAERTDVYPGKIFIDKNGNETTGTMPNNGAVDKTLDMSLGSNGEYTNAEYTVPSGYHNGNGKVKIEFESEQVVEPDRNRHDIRPVAGKVLSTVIVQPIPTELQDVSGVTATADKVLEGSYFVDKLGNKVEGEMLDIDEQTIWLTLENRVVDLDRGFHRDTSVGIVVEDEKEVTPNKTTQTITPSNPDNLLSTVKVLPIPSAYQDLTDQNIEPADVITGKRFVSKNGALTDGTMPKYGVIERNIEWTDFSASPYFELTVGGYVNGISIGVNTSALEEALSEI